MSVMVAGCHIDALHGGSAPRSRRERTDPTHDTTSLARQLIADGRTRFIVELHSHRYAAFGTSAEEILDLFDPARWRFGRIRDDGSVEAMDRAAFLAHDSRSGIEDQLLFEPVTA